MKKIYSTGIDWVRMVVAVGACITVLFLWHYNIETTHHTNTPLLFIARIFIVLLLLAVASVRHTLYEEYLITYIFVFPVRRVLWEEISRALFIPRKNPGYKNAYSDRILLLKHADEQKALSVSQTQNYLKQHPYRAIQINVPHNKKEEYILAFEKCLGYPVKMDMPYNY